MTKDKIDFILTRLCRDKPGRQIDDLISNFMEILPVGLPLLSDRAIRVRLNSLEKEGLIHLDRESVKRRVFCYVTKEGEQYLAGQLPAQSQEDRAV